MAVYFVTSNRFKFEEAKKILGVDLKQKKLGIHEVQSLKVKEVVEDKAMKAYEKVRKPVMVEDTALYIKSWKNFPGPLITWVVKTIGVDGIPKLVGKDRSAKAEACIGYYDGKRLKMFSGTKKGMISRKPRGRKRFDWDRIFVPEGEKRTYSEMSLEEKNRISHRMKALVKLEKFLSSEVK